MSLGQIKRLSYTFKTRPDGSFTPAGPAETHDGIINCEVVVYDDTRGSWVSLPMYDIKTADTGPAGGRVISTTVESADGPFRVLLTYNNKRSLRVPTWTIQKPFVSRMFVDGREQATCETTVLPESRCNPVDLTSCFTAEQCLDGANYFFWRTRSSDWPAITAPPSNGSLIDDHSSITFRLQSCTVHDVQKGISKFPSSDPFAASADGDEGFKTVLGQHSRLSHYIHIADEDNESIASQDIPDFTVNGQPSVEFVIYYKNRALLQQLGILKAGASRARRTPQQRGQSTARTSAGPIGNSVSRPTSTNAVRNEAHEQRTPGNETSRSHSREASPELPDFSPRRTLSRHRDSDGINTCEALTTSSQGQRPTNLKRPTFQPSTSGEDACDTNSKHRRIAPVHTSTHVRKSLNNADPAQNIVNAHMNTTPPRTPSTSSRILPQLTGSPPVQSIEGASNRASTTHPAPNTSSMFFIPNHGSESDFPARAKFLQPRPPLRPPRTRSSDATEVKKDSARNNPEESVLSRMQTQPRAETARAAAPDDIRDLSPSVSAIDLGRRGPQYPQLHDGSHHSATHTREIHSDQVQAMSFTPSQRRGVSAGQSKEMAILCDSDDDLEGSQESSSDRCGGRRANTTGSRPVKVESIGSPVKTSAEVFLTKVFPAGPHPDIVTALVKFGFRDETSFRDTRQQLVKEKQLGPLEKLSEAIGYAPYSLLKNYIHKWYKLELEV